MSELVVRNMSVRCKRPSKWWPELHGQTLPKAWRVCLVVDGSPKPFPMAFARERDAAAAKAALDSAHLNTMKDIQKSTRQEFEQYMLEAMSW